MKIVIPKVIKRLDLGDYNAALSGQHVCFWVNPTLAVLREHDAFVAESDVAEKNATSEKPYDPAVFDLRSFQWYAKVFSQDEDTATHWTATELSELKESDPSFWFWLLSKYWDARREHTSKKKVS